MQLDFHCGAVSAEVIWVVLSKGFSIADTIEGSI